MRESRFRSEPEPGGSGVFLKLRTISMDSWGEDVAANIRGEGTYIFDTSNGVNSTNRFEIIEGAPIKALFMLVSMDDRTMILFGAHDGANLNPMLIRYCASENYNDWEATYTNNAGDLLIDKGTEIITAVYTKKLIFVLTDTAAYVMVRQDFPIIYSIDHVGSECGGISPGCAIAVNNRIYWMSGASFYMYDGVVQPLECDVHSDVFGNMNITQRDKITCGHNPDFKEIWWCFPSAGSSENNMEVIYNYQEKTWAVGARGRTAFASQQAFFTKPIAATPDHILVEHENGTNDSGVAIPYVYETYDFQLNDGNNIAMVTKILPDFKDFTGSCAVSFNVKKEPEDNAKTIGPKTILPSTRKKSFKARGRQISMKIEANDPATSFTLGPVRVKAADDGEE